MPSDESISITEQILPTEDQLYRKQSFISALDRIAEVDQQLQQLVKRFGSEGGSSGKTIEAMEEKANQQRTSQNIILNSAESTIDQAIKRFDEQVDAMKTQNMTIYYKNNLSSAF
ncbi:hypothetical protein E2R51_16585 [Jeotgalibacillus sp. S-D1]|uniref:hypothetical protein n=1 Tax=Jeotgalibacillus sp. S-D1 TaxID=2552189 RepID=UPI001059A78D|nr:hypothetical protein [Jeotgalibacillus sp. S-D1]TDL30939.1 hypothetical protein E2R51_16585 [Jeotgalibacillus sp. S-D1]